MSSRVIIGLKSDTDWNLVKPRILALGAQHVSDPTSYQPDAVVATLKPGQDPAVFISNVQRLESVRYAEPDAMSGTC